MDEINRANLSKKTEAMNFWSGGGDLYYWTGENLLQWQNDQLINWDAKWYDYIIKDDKFTQRCVNSWFNYSKGRDMTYNIYQKILDEL